MLISKSNVAKDVVYFALDVWHQVDISHYRDLENLLATMYYDREYETMIKVEALLID